MRLTNRLELKRCPHCSIANPNINQVTNFETKSANGYNERFWIIYICSNCGGAIMTSRNKQSDEMIELIPQMRYVDSCIPERPRQFLLQALETIHAPAGSIMLSASSIDAMLKDMGYKKGSLYERIEKAANDHIITAGMSECAHKIRLEANDQRHSDEDSVLPTEEDAKRIVEFAFPLADFLYVLPNKVNKGIEETKKK
jgi:hypothetical protein